MPKIFKKKPEQTIKLDKPPALDLLSIADTFNISLEERASLTISCRDTDYIPKVKNAGSFGLKNNQKIQVMHNGLTVKNGGYYGDWMARIIMELKGHHEPQEEKVFYELLNRLGPNSTMIELGSFWAYYSLWFNSAIEGATNICCEPDSNNIEIGKLNAKLNSLNLTFINSAAGNEEGKIIDFPLESEPGKTTKVPIIKVDELVKKYQLDKLDILHMDVQGHELDGIKSALDTIKKGKLRFLLVSTHHYSISGDPLTHFDCEKLIRQHGGHIISSHTVLESYSGDGMIAASFSEKDKDLTIPVSINSSAHSLYRPYEYDLATMIREYENLRNPES